MAIQDRSISPWGFVGLIGMVAAFFPYAVSGLVMPLWMIPVMLLVWVVMFVVTCRWFMSHPKRTLVMPVIAFALWFSVVALGATQLGWNA